MDAGGSLAGLRHGLHCSRVGASWVKVGLVVDSEQIDSDHSGVVFQRTNNFPLHGTRGIKEHEKM